jgi:hypothetical protein
MLEPDRGALLVAGHFAGHRQKAVDRAQRGVHLAPTERGGTTSACVPGEFGDVREVYHQNGCDAACRQERGRLVAEPRQGLEGSATGGNHLAVPLVGLDDVIGILFVRDGAYPYDERHVRRLSVVAASLAAYFSMLRALNKDSLVDPKVHVINQDAMVWLAQAPERYDVVIVDFPDPNNFALGKLYTTRFYNLLRERLAPGAAASVQSTSPMFARTSFWCIARTMEAAGFVVRPYHLAVPSFGEWGFNLAKLEGFAAPDAAPALEGLRYLNDDAVRSLFLLPRDLREDLDVEVNRLNNQILVHYYEREWRRWN